MVVLKRREDWKDSQVTEVYVRSWANEELGHWVKNGRKTTYKKA